jgi:DNA replication protein DnaC
MSSFTKIKDPLSKFDDGYEQNNPNILKHLVGKLEGGEPFHYLFTGVVGCGKTYLANNIVRSTGVRWDVVKVIKFYEKYLNIMTSGFSDKWSAIGQLNSIMNSKLLVVDDLGDEKPSTDAAHDYFSNLMELRHHYIYKNPECRTIITTNLNANQIIETYSSRVMDRLQEYFVICKFNKTSFRKKNLVILES